MATNQIIVAALTTMCLGMLSFKQARISEYMNNSQTSFDELKISEHGSLLTDKDTAQENVTIVDFEALSLLSQERQDRFNQVFRGLTNITDGYEGLWQADQNQNDQQDVSFWEDYTDVKKGKMRGIFVIQNDIPLNSTSASKLPNSNSLVDKSEQATTNFEVVEETNVNMTQPLHLSIQFLETRLCFYAGKYRDDEVCIHSVFNTLSDPLVEVYDLGDGVYTITNLITDVQLRKSQRAIHEMIIRLNMTFYTNVDTEQQEQIKDSYDKFTGVDSSTINLMVRIDHNFTKSDHPINFPDHLNLYLSKTPPGQLQDKMANFSFLVTSILIMFYYLAMMTIRDSMTDIGLSQSFSLLSIGINLLWNFFYFSFFFQLSMNAGYSQYMSMPAFWFFVSAFTFISRLMIISWRSQMSQEQLYNQSYQRNRLTRFYCTFYLIAFGVTLFENYFLFNNYALIMFNSTLWIPQIYRNYMKRQKKFASFYFYTSMSCVQSFIPIYLKCCPYNLLERKPDILFGFIMISFITLQLLVMYSQKKWHSRWFIPKAWRRNPNAYEYYHDVPLHNIRSGDIENQISDENMCVICMNPVHYQVDQHGQLVVPKDSSENSNSDHIAVSTHDDDDDANTTTDEFHEESQEQTRPKLAKKFMLTPCNHSFHEVCLKKWMEVRMECPTCRQSIPYPDDDD